MEAHSRMATVVWDLRSGLKAKIIMKTSPNPRITILLRIVTVCSLFLALSASAEENMMKDAVSVPSNSALLNVVVSATAETSSGVGNLDFRLSLRNESNEGIVVSDPLTGLRIQFASADEQPIPVLRGPGRGLGHARGPTPYASLVKFEQMGLHRFFGQ